MAPLVQGLLARHTIVPSLLLGTCPHIGRVASAVGMQSVIRPITDCDSSEVFPHGRTGDHGHDSSPARGRASPMTMADWTMSIVPVPSLALKPHPPIPAQQPLNIDGASEATPMAWVMIPLLESSLISLLMVRRNHSLYGRSRRRARGGHPLYLWSKACSADLRGGVPRGCLSPQSLLGVSCDLLCLP